MDEARSDGIYLGIDITGESALISYYKTDMEEPETVSTVLGSESYQIPAVLAKRSGVGQWFFGNDAKRQAGAGLAVLVDHLYDAALYDRKILIEAEEYAARDLFVIYLQKLLSLTGRFINKEPVRKLVFTVPVMSLSVVELFTLIAPELKISPGQLMIIDHRESFYYYVLSQDEKLYAHDVMLFDYSKTALVHCQMKRNVYSTPQVITLSSGNHGRLTENKDSEFEAIIGELFDGEFISSVFLTGDGFDGDWMKTSLQSLCRGRRVFLGKNLYSKGACYAGAVKDGKKDWKYLYIGDNELKMNLALKVNDKNEMSFFNLINAGDNWYETGGECEVILDGTPEIEVWVQRLDNRQTRIEVLELRDLPDRENRMTRLRISAKAQSDKQVMITIKDLGFGEIVPSSGKVWKHTIGIA